MKYCFWGIFGWTRLKKNKITLHDISLTKQEGLKVACEEVFAGK
jgi:hypothetical protein